MQRELTEKEIELFREYFIKETEGLIAELSNLLDEKEKLQREFDKQEHNEKCVYRNIWTNCKNLIIEKNYSGEIIKRKKFKEVTLWSNKEEVFWSKKNDMDNELPLIIEDMEYRKFKIKDLRKRGYLKTEFQKAISYIQKYIDLYKEGIETNSYYFKFIQELGGLVLLYDISIKESDRKVIIKNLSDSKKEWQEILDELMQLIKEKDKIVKVHRELLTSENESQEDAFFNGRAWRICRDDVKGTIGLSSMAEREGKYLPFMSCSYHNYFNNYFYNHDHESGEKTPKVIKDFERSRIRGLYINIDPNEYSKEALLKAKRYMKQHLIDLEASIALAYELISSNYYGNFLDDLEVLVRKY